MPSIHKTAIVDPAAQLADDVTIGPYCIIEGPVRLAAGCSVGAAAQIIGDVQIGEGTSIGRTAIIGGDPQDFSFDPATPSGIRIGTGNIIREQVTIHRSTAPGGNTTIGDRNLIMAVAHLAHDVQMGDENVLANAALLAGHVHIADHVFLGGGAGVHQFMRVGSYATLQGNGQYSQDVPPFCTVTQHNILSGLNVIGLRRGGFDRESRAAIKEVFDLVFRSDRNLTQSLAQARTQEWPPAAESLLQFLEAPAKKGVVRRTRTS